MYRHHSNPPAHTPPGPPELTESAFNELGPIWQNSQTFEIALQYRFNDILRNISDNNANSQMQSLCEALSLIGWGVAQSVATGDLVSEAANYSLILSRSVSEVLTYGKMVGKLPENGFLLISQAIELIALQLERPICELHRLPVLIECLETLSENLRPDLLTGRGLREPCHDFVRGAISDLIRNRLAVASLPTLGVLSDGHDTLEAQFALLTAVVRFGNALQLSELTADYCKAAARIYSLMPPMDADSSSPIGFYVKELFCSLITGLGRFHQTIPTERSNLDTQTIERSLSRLLEAHSPEWVAWPHCLQAYAKLSNDSLHHAKELLEERLLASIEIGREADIRQLGAFIEEDRHASALLSVVLSDYPSERIGSLQEMVAEKLCENEGSAEDAQMIGLEQLLKSDFRLMSSYLRKEFIF